MDGKVSPEKLNDLLLNGGAELQPEVLPQSLCAWSRSSSYKDQEKSTTENSGTITSTAWPHMSRSLQITN